MSFKTLFVVICLGVVTTAFLSCVDVPADGQTPPDFRSEFRFANAAEDLGSVGITVDGQSVGMVDYASATQRQDFPSGDRLAVLSNGDTLRVGMASEHRSTVVILPLTGEDREFVTLLERFTYNDATTEEPSFRIAHAALASVIDDVFNITLAGPDTIDIEGGISFRDVTSYQGFTPGDYEISVVAAADTSETVLGTTNVSLTNNTRYTTIVVGDSTSVQFINLTDN